MTDKELKKLSRQELIELFIKQSNELEQLKTSYDTISAQLNEKELKISKIGSLADASIRLNNVFESADAAAKQYIENIKKYESEQYEKCDRALADAKDKATVIIAKAEIEKNKRITEADAYWNSLSQKLEKFYSLHKGLKKLVENSIGEIKTENTAN